MGDTGDSVSPETSWGRKTLGGGNGNPFWYSYLRNPMDRGTWWAQRVRCKWAQMHTTWLFPGIIVVQSPSHVLLFVTPWTVAFQASLSFTITRSSLKLMSMSEWWLTLVFSPGKFHGLRRLLGYGLGGHTESDMTEHAYMHLLSQNFLPFLQSAYFFLNYVFVCIHQYYYLIHIWFLHWIVSSTSATNVCMFIYHCIPSI